ncbi:transketolase [Candidatus Gottesmanbacteria bacterium]|nr:transketolase [Candidatus Gottesmanbacteria bacterium]
MRNAFVQSLGILAKRDKKLILLTGDLGYTVFEDFKSKFPKQFLNVGVAEANMMGVACGFALTGFTPIVYSIATFVTMRGFEQIRNDICLHYANVKIIGTGGGLSYGHAGATHHSLEDIAIMRSLPNIIIVCPSDRNQVKAAFVEILKHKGPVYFRLGKKGEPDIYTPTSPFTIGKGIILKRGADLTLIATGNMVYNGLQAARILSQKGVDTGIIDMHTVKPLDEDVIIKVAKATKAIFTLEEHSIVGGLGTAVSEVLSEKGKEKIYFKRLGINDTFIETVGNQEYLRHIYGLSIETIVRRILKDFTKYA